MSQQPWIDGAVTSPKVGDLVKARFKGSDYDSVYEVSVPSSFSDKHDTVLVTRDQLAASTYVPPEPLMPVPVLDLDENAPVVLTYGSYWVVRSQGSYRNGNYIAVYGSTQRIAIKRWNVAVEAIRAMKKETQ